jgi:hypothetical protein
LKEEIQEIKKEEIKEENENVYFEKMEDGKIKVTSLEEIEERRRNEKRKKEEEEKKMEDLKKEEEKNQKDLKKEEERKKKEEKINNLKKGMYIKKEEEEIIDPQKVVHLKNNWFQTYDEVVVSIIVKDTKKEEVSISYTNNSFKITIKEDLQDEYHLFDEIVPEKCKFKNTQTKIEITLAKKNEGEEWKDLEKEFVPKKFLKTPYAGKGGIVKDWDVVEMIADEESKEDPVGDEALNFFLKDLYSKGFFFVNNFSY